MGPALRGQCASRCFAVVLFRQGHDSGGETGGRALASQTSQGLGTLLTLTPSPFFQQPCHCPPARVRAFRNGTLTVPASLSFLEELVPCPLVLAAPSGGPVPLCAAVRQVDEGTGTEVYEQCFLWCWGSWGFGE